MFTQSCYIRKISKDLSKKLESLGYKESKFVVFASPEITATYCKSGKYAATIENPALLNAIDCGENEELFLAIAALRDDTDKNQWFIYDSMDAVIESFRVYEWFICNEDKIEDMMFYDSHYLNTHKATVEELIEHFNSLKK